MAQPPAQPAPRPARSDPARMACLEVRGGNLPVDTALATRGLDVWITSRPFGVATTGTGTTGGGDIHLVSSCATGRISRLLVADLSGHGPALADAARELKRLMNLYSNFIDQSRFVAAVNTHLAGLISSAPPAAGARGSALFATGVFATYFAPSARLSLCNAGHPPPLRYDARAGAWSEVTAPDTPGQPTDRPTGLPLGILDDTAYPAAQLTLAPGDLVLLYTDALIEAADPAGRQLGVRGLLGTLAPLDPAQPAGLIAGLLDRVRAHTRADGFDDDLTIMLIAQNGLAPRPSIGTGLAATGRLIARALGSLMHRDRPMPAMELTMQNIVGAFVQHLNR